MTTTATRHQAKPTSRARSRTSTKARERTNPGPVAVSRWRPRGARNGLRFVDYLCGAGGSSAGLSNAGWDLRFAVNHWDVAIATHQANFPDVWHECLDVTSVNIRSLPHAEALWISPICTELSPAGGKSTGYKRSEASKLGQRSILDEIEHIKRMRDESEQVADEGLEKTRATFWSAIQYAEVKRPEIIFLENVPQVVDGWRLFDNWLHTMESLGYRWQIISVNSAHIGGEGIPYAPQWRDRMYIVFVRMDISKVPDITPRPLSYCFGCREVVEGVQTWCPSAAKRAIKVGAYRRKAGTSYGQYWYTCPRGCRTGGTPARVEPFIRPAAAAIDWTDLGTPIGENRLKPNTVARVKEGIDQFWNRPTVTTVRGNTFERAGYLRAWPADLAPLPTQQCSFTDALAVPPGTALPFTMVPGGRWYSDPELIDVPMRTQLASDRHNESLVIPPGGAEPFLAMLRRNAEPGSVRDPMAAFTAGGNHHALVVPYYTKGVSTTPGEPFPTFTTKDRFALARGGDGGYTIDDVTYRMVRWDEAARSQVLPIEDGYVLTGTDGERMAQAGNAVSSNAAQWLGERGAEILV